MAESVGSVLQILFCLIFGINGLPRADPLVETKVGTIRGLHAEDGDYSMFLGIPFGTVDPLNPFGISTPRAPFETTYDAIDDSIVCPQREPYHQTLVGDVDCLRLNVYVPRNIEPNARLPVMVYIYGGSYRDGSAEKHIYGPQFLIKHDVIVVNINYRLSVYGFLCLDTPEIPGNQGLKDQLMALRWVKNNIEAFGGDSDKITIFGESAGAVSMELHVLYSKPEEELFHNVIIQSGGALLGFADPQSNINAPFILAEHLGFKTDSLNEALQFLRAIKTDDLIQAALDTNFRSRICVEKEFDNVERYITERPINADAPNAKTKPMLLGYNDNEFGNLFKSIPPEDYDLFSELLDVFTFDESYLNEMKQLLLKFYIGDEEISLDVEDQLVKYVADAGFFNPAYRSMKKFFDNGATSIYHYVFGYEGDRNFNKIVYNNTDYPGALHADELSYLFHTEMIKDPITARDQRMIDIMTTLWTNFAKYGKPIPEETELLPFQWPVATEEVMHYLDIVEDIGVQKRPFQDRMAFWDMFLIMNDQYLKR